MIPKKHTITFHSPIKDHLEISEEGFDADEAAAIIVRELEVMDNTPLHAATSIASHVRLFLLHLFLIHLFLLHLIPLCLYLFNVIS